VADPEAEFCYGEMLADVEKLPVTEACNKPLRIAISRSHNTEETFTHINAFKLKHPDAVVSEQGSSYKFCLIAEGTFDYYIRTTGTYEWDTAAGELILAEAGGSTLSYPEGKPLGYNKEDLRNPWFEARSASCKL
jgi:3'(2'), 5'-bisphosphate nucleotidase